VAMNDLNVVQKEMALTRKMFFETLPHALGGDDFNVDGDEVTISNSSQSLVILFQEKANFKLGGFSIPRADVTLTFTGFDAEQREEVLLRFNRYFHRGGG